MMSTRSPHWFLTMWMCESKSMYIRSAGINCHLGAADVLLCLGVEMLWQILHCRSNQESLLYQASTAQQAHCLFYQDYSPPCLNSFCLLLCLQTHQVVEHWLAARSQMWCSAGWWSPCMHRAGQGCSHDDPHWGGLSSGTKQIHQNSSFSMPRAPWCMVKANYCLILGSILGKHWLQHWSSQTVHWNMKMKLNDTGCWDLATPILFWSRHLVPRLGSLRS